MQLFWRFTTIVYLSGSYLYCITQILAAQVKDLEALAEFNTQLQEEVEGLKEEVSLIKRESKLSRKADKTGQDSLVMLNRELQQVVLQRKHFSANSGLLHPV